MKVKPEPHAPRLKGTRKVAVIGAGACRHCGAKYLREAGLDVTSNGIIVTDIAYNRITVKHGIERIQGKTLRFADGTAEDVDVLNAATDYLFDLDYIFRDIVSLTDNRLDLYKRLVQPGWPGLSFPASSISTRH